MVENIRKIAFLLSITVILGGCDKKSEEQNDRQKKGYNGEIRYVREIIYSTIKENGTLVKGQVLSDNNFIQFNKLGVIIEKGCYNFDSSTNTSYGKTQYQYNDAGFLIEEVAQINKPSKSVLYQIEKIEYDTIINKPIEKLIFVIASKSVTKEKPDIKITYEYDVDGHMIRSHSLSNLTDTESLYTYNKEGKVVEQINTETNQKFTYEYDKHDNCIEENEYKDDKLAVRKTSIFDSKGNEIECVVEDIQKNTTTKIVVKYDKQNNPIYKERIIDGNLEDKQTIIYEYDEQANWIKQTLTQEEKNADWSGIIVERQIEYFTHLYAESKDPILQSFDNNMVFVKGGTFMMGSDTGKDNERPSHQVTLSDFYMSRYEITQAQWEYVMGNNPSNFKRYKECPVEQISWNSIDKFIDKLNLLTGKQYRLPTEAEWEYAAKGGNLSRSYKYTGSNTLGYVAWHGGIWMGEGNSGDRTHPVGQKLPNELGLYDMFGNITEACSDWFQPYSSESQINPKGAESGYAKIWRGGSWYNAKEAFRYTSRGSGGVSVNSDIAGFRLCITSINN